MRKLLLLIIMVVSSTTLFAQVPPLNISLASNLSSIGAANDCWGWWDGQGNEYAIVGIQAGGVDIIDITNPSSPQVVASTQGVPSLWRDIKSFGNYVYVVNDDGGSGGVGLQIIDMTTLPNIVYKDTMIQGLEYTHNLYIEDGYAYLTGNNNNAGINIYNLNTDPWNPTQVGQYTQTYVHDVYVRNNKAYSCELGQGLTVIDVSNKSNPQVLGNRQYVNNFTHNSWLSDNGNVCFTTDETSGGYVYAWDVTDPQNIIELDDYRSSLGGPNTDVIPHNTHVLNDYLVTSYYRDGMTVVDAQYPYNMIEVGHYDTSPMSGDGFDGDWGAYPFFPSGTVIASDMQLGLFVFNVSYERACYLEGDVTDAITNQPIPNATITVQGQTWGTNADNVGFYATGTHAPGSYTVTYSAFGYNDSTITVNLANGVLEVRDIPLNPLATVNATITVVETGSGLPVPNAVVSLVETSGAASFDYTADANGNLNVPSLVQGNYNVIAGQWGWVTAELPWNPNSSNNTITITLDEGYYDDFALDLGWTVTSTASTGAWERGEPDGTTLQGQPSNPDFDLPGDIGDQAYVTGNGGGNAGNDDVDDGITELTSPVFDLSGYQDPVVRYSRWFFMGGGFGGGANDSLTIEISNGITTVVLNQIDIIWNNWVQDTFIVSNYIAPTANMKITFRAGDYGQGHIVEAAIDGFSVGDLTMIAIEDEPIENQVELGVFPNPVGQNATIRYDFGTELDGEAVFEVADLTGRVLQRINLSEANGEFQLDFNMASGLYFGSLRNKGVAVKTVRIMK